MKLKNLRNQEVVVHYRGIGGSLRLGPNAISAELPAIVAEDRNLQREVVIGRMAIVLSSEESAARTAPVQPVPASPPQPQARPERETGDKPIVDLVANELAVKLMMMKPEGRAAELAKYKRSGNPNFLNAVKEVEKRVAAMAEKDGDESARAVVETVHSRPEAPEPPVKPVTAIVDGVVTDLARTEATIREALGPLPEAPKPAKAISPLALPEPPAEVVVVGESSPVPSLDDMSRKQLYELAKTRGLAVTSKMNVKDLTEALMRP